MAVKIKVSDPGDKAHVEQYVDIYGYGALDPGVHRRLVEELDRVAQKAGINKKYIYQPAAINCTDGDQSYMTAMKSYMASGIFGYVITGDKSLTRMSGMIGLALRNFIDARLITLQDLLTMLKDGDEPHQRIVAVPNFHVPANDGGHIAHWQTGQILGWLMGRMSRDQLTILHTPSKNAMAIDYGTAVGEFLDENYHWGK